MNRVKYLYTLFPEYLVNGAIFSKMNDAPWAAVNAGLDMDIAYLASYSGIKTPAYFINTFISEDGVLDQQKLADVLWTLFGQNWKRLWDAYMSEYDPLNNYDIAETINRQTNTDRVIDRDVSETGTVNSTDKYDSTTTTKDTGESTSSEKAVTDYGKSTHLESETDAFTHAFNTVSAVPTAVTTVQSTESESGSDTTTTTGTTNSENNGSIVVDSTETTNTGTTSKTEDDTKDNIDETEEIIRSRKGNIGQNTYQELLRQEFEVWKWNFYRQVFSDCDSVLCLSVFSGFCGHIYDRFSTVN